MRVKGCALRERCVEVARVAGTTLRTSIFVPLHHSSREEIIEDHLTTTMERKVLGRITATGMILAYSIRSFVFHVFFLVIKAKGLVFPKPDPGHGMILVDIAS